MRLSEKHPTFKKLQKIFDLMDELGISINPYSFGVGDTTVSDKDFPKKVFELRDLEDCGEGRYQLELPPTMEYKVVYDKED